MATPDKPNPLDHTSDAVRMERHTYGFEFGAKPGHAITDNSDELPKVIRDFKITDAHLRKYGYTVRVATPSGMTTPTGSTVGAAGRAVSRRSEQSILRRPSW